MLKTRYSAATSPISDCQKYFSRERMPSGSLRTPLRQSSTPPIAPKPTVTACPIFSSVSRRSTDGPATRPISSAVIAAITARNVRYWNTLRKPKSGLIDCNQLVRLSSMRFSLAQDRFDHAFHLHEARPLHQHARGRLQFRGTRGNERIDVREMAALHRDRLLAQREELVAEPGTRMLADFGME